VAPDPERSHITPPPDDEPSHALARGDALAAAAAALLAPWAPAAAQAKTISIDLPDAIADFNAWELLHSPWLALGLAVAALTLLPGIIKARRARSSSPPLRAAIASGRAARRAPGPRPAFGRSGAPAWVFV
jgi:hypothetical protein